MGTYSKSFSWQEMIKMGFIKESEIDSVFKCKWTDMSGQVKSYNFYFRFYDINTPYASAYLNVGSVGLIKEGLKVFKVCTKEYQEAKELIRGVEE